MLANILMAAGGIAWLTGELYGASTHGPTTSGWAWWAERKWPILRPFLGVFLVSLVGHILYGWTLLP